MKGTWIFRTLAVAATVALAMVAVPAPMAGNYHYGTTLTCNDCHSMHYSQTHDFTDNASGTIPPLTSSVGATTGPYKKLLHGDSVSNACLACHNSSTSYPDVFQANGGTQTYVRQAGALNNLSSAGSGTEDYYKTDGHTLGNTSNPPGKTFDTGGEGDAGLDCGDCHNVHGSTNFRNLLLKPGGVSSDLAITYGAATTNLTDVANTWVAGLANFPASYGVGGVNFQRPVAADSATGAWCNGCHGGFHDVDSESGTTTGTEWLRHPTGGAEIGAVADDTHSSGIQFVDNDNVTKVMSANAQWTNAIGMVATTVLGGSETTADASDEVVTCVSCHKSHGNKNPFGLIYMAGTATATLTEEGDGGTIKDLCQQCHVQGVGQ